MKKLLLVTSLVLLPVLLVGGSVYAWGIQEPAVARTHERAVDLFNAMDTYAGTTALDRAREATRYPGVTVMVARNTAGGHEIVLGITAADDHRNNFDWWPTQNARYEATRCYRWTDDRRWDTAEEVDCPAHKDIDRTRAAEAHPISGRVDRLLERTLTRTRSVGEVRTALAATCDPAGALSASLQTPPH